MQFGIVLQVLLICIFKSGMPASTQPLKAPASADPMTTASRKLTTHDGDMLTTSNTDKYKVDYRR